MIFLLLHYRNEVHQWEQKGEEPAFKSCDQRFKRSFRQENEYRFVASY